MSVTRRVTFRLYPKPAQEKKLFEWKRLHCNLYARPESASLEW
jgi:putative transposase